MQFQAILSLSDPSVNRENFCKAKPGVFLPTAWFFPNSVFLIEIFLLSRSLTIQLFKERGCTGSSLKPHTFEPNCRGLLRFYIVHFDGSPSVKTRCCQDKNPNIIHRSPSQSVQRHCCESGSQTGRSSSSLVPPCLCSGAFLAL